MAIEFWSVVAGTKEKPPEILIYNRIGKGSPLDKGVSSEQFAKDLRALGDAPRINIRINSGGGSLFEGQAIYSLLKGFAAEKHVYVDGLAASAASIIAMAGDVIHVPANGTIMIHNARVRVDGEQKDFEHAAEVLSELTTAMVAVYVERTKLPEAKIRDMLNKETWMSGATAVALGFADVCDIKHEVAAEYTGDQLVVNGVVMDVSEYINCPFQKTQSNTEGDGKMSVLDKIRTDLSTEELQEFEALMQTQIADAVTAANASVLTEAQAAWDIEKAGLQALVIATQEDTESPLSVEDSLPEEVKALLAEARNQAAVAEAKVQAMQQETELSTMKATLKTFDKLPLGEDLAATFCNFAKADQEGFVKVQALLTAANNAIAQGVLFTAVGSGSTPTGSALDQLNAKAAAMAASTAGMTKEAAFVEACRANAELYELYQQERMGDE